MSLFAYGLSADYIVHRAPIVRPEYAATETVNKLAEVKRSWTVNGSRSHKGHRSEFKVVAAELSMGQFCVNQSNPTHQLINPSQPNKN